MGDDFELMPTWRSLNDAARQAGVSRRTITQWISDGKLTVYQRAGDRKRYVDLDEVKQLREFRPIKPKDVGGAAPSEGEPGFRLDTDAIKEHRSEPPPTHCRFCRGRVEQRPAGWLCLDCGNFQ